jgi:hypothetical protein
MNFDEETFNPFFYLDRRLIEALHDDNMEKYLEIIKIKYEEERVKSEEKLLLQQIKKEESIKMEQIEKEEKEEKEEKKEDLYNNKIFEKDYKISLIRNIIDNITSLEKKLKKI